jgi:hypothetical protein
LVVRSSNGVKILLVLSRNEAAGNHVEHAPGAHQKHRENGEYRAAQRGEPRHAVAVAVRGALEHAVEDTEESTEHLVDGALEGIGRRVARLQQQRRERGRERQGVECRDDGARGGETFMALHGATGTALAFSSAEVPFAFPRHWRKISGN